jgi:glycerophosphoryl diester phosphodiesterase
MHSAEGMKQLAAYADGVGPSTDMIVLPDSTPDNIRITDLVANAHAAGLQVHPYTFRRDPGRVPDYAGDFERLLEIFLVDVAVDGVFTDFPDLAVGFLESLAE